LGLPSSTILQVAEMKNKEAKIIPRQDAHVRQLLI